MCLYCGLDVVGANNHANTEECIAALELELYRLTECLQQQRLNGAAPSSPQPEPGAHPAHTSWDPLIIDQLREALRSRQSSDAHSAIGETKRPPTLAVHTEITPPIATDGGSDSNPVA